MIAQKESCDIDLVEVAALLHDVDDKKLFSAKDYANARKIMDKCGYEKSFMDKVIHIIKQVSYSANAAASADSLEGCIVQDADRLDALGAIGMARAFSYGGYRGRALYNPVQLTGEDMEKNSTTIDHFST